MQYNTAASVVKSAIAVEKAVREADLILANHESNLNQAKTPQAYNFAYKAYENEFKIVRSFFQEAESGLAAIESKLHLLNGLPRITVEQQFKKIKKMVSKQLAKTKIPKMEVG